MDILTLLTSDHRRFHEMIARLDAQAFDSQSKYYTREWTHEVGKPLLAILRKLVPELSRHEEIEHRLLFEALRRRDGEFTEILEAMDEEHDAIKEILADFLGEVTIPDMLPSRKATLRFLSLMNLFQQHMMREESEIFELARRRIPAEELERLGREATEPAFAA